MIYNVKLRGVTVWLGKPRFSSDGFVLNLLRVIEILITGSPRVRRVRS